ncbi:hypothetical protein BDV39DRAFT_200057 [Aspergillus sergii]|uniref:MAC/Perforin domain-containing protein n=1 Tax=Aspergillus sergii TaxID=1034303 RepID=A0A5N6XGR0_9EURO|nr:hypothetical protein BDV39DRAFT_200057 [Aspergillus sergii]
MAAELVPYFDGMQQGQGYNTYLQELRVADAVTITPGNPLPNTYDIFYHSEEVTEYKKLAQSLDITAGAAISGWGQKANVDASYLNRSEFESSTITYQVEVSSRQQGAIGNKYSFNNINTNEPHETYGDRFIADFINGGKYLARVSITATSQSSKQEIKQSAEVAFKMYGSTGTVTEEIRQAVESLHKNSRTKVWTHISGGGRRNGNETQSYSAESPDASSQLIRIKEEADEFYRQLMRGEHPYRRFAVLWKYTNVQNFNDAFKPLDYSIASRKSWSLFDDFTQYRTFIDGVTKVPVNKFIEGETDQKALYKKGVEVVGAISTKVQAISKDPNDVEKPLSYDYPWVFQTTVLKKRIMTVMMIAQRRPLQDGSPTDIASRSLERGAERLFEFKAYDFGDILGSSVVSFGKKDSSFICLSGLRASDYGYKEESYFWVFNDQVNGIAEQKVIVSKIRSADRIQLSCDSEGPKFLFNFYAGKGA